jgi:putative endonuclease
MALASAKGLGFALKPSQLLWKLSDHARQAREAHTLHADAALGRRGEDLAHRYLQTAGYSVVARNYKPGTDSEIDIIARKKDLVVFVEVKSRLTADYGSPERAVDSQKQKNIFRAARAYSARAAVDWTLVRFDIISVVFSKPPSILHQQDAFYPTRRDG